MKDMENGDYPETADAVESEMESEEYIKAYDVVPVFSTYESLQTGAPGAKVRK